MISAAGAAVRRAILSMARKNGKTALIAAIALAHLVGPEAIVHGEIYSAANDRDQAAIVFKFAKQMVELEPDLRNRSRSSSSTKRMVARRTASVYRAISAEAGTKHGYLPSVVIYDELAQAKGRDLYDVLDTSFGARDEPLFIIMSTQSNDPEHIMSKLIDDGLAGNRSVNLLPSLRRRRRLRLDDEEQWLKANPALGDFRDYEDLASAMRKAKRLVAEEPKVRNLFLNQRVSPAASLISRTEWMACAGEVEFADHEEVYLAIDLSSVADLTALVMGSASDPARMQAVLLEAARASGRAFASRFRRGKYALRRMGERRASARQPRQDDRPGSGRDLRRGIEPALSHPRRRLRSLAHR